MHIDLIRIHGPVDVHVAIGCLDGHAQKFEQAVQVVGVALVCLILLLVLLNHSVDDPGRSDEVLNNDTGDSVVVSEGGGGRALLFRR